MYFSFQQSSSYAVPLMGSFQGHSRPLLWLECLIFWALLYFIFHLQYNKISQLLLCILMCINIYCLICRSSYIVFQYYCILPFGILHPFFGKEWKINELCWPWKRFASSRRMEDWDSSIHLYLVMPWYQKPSGDGLIIQISCGKQYKDVNMLPKLHKKTLSKWMEKSKVQNFGISLRETIISYKIIASRR